MKQPSMHDTKIDDLVGDIAEQLEAAGMRMASAESCTGGLIAVACTDRPGSSAWFERGFVTYSNEAKQECLGVQPAMIKAHGAVSEPVVRAMLSGLLARCPVDWAVAVSGVAGPGGGSPEKPVGTVIVGWMQRSGTADVERYCLDGDRLAVRAATLRIALAGLCARLAGSSVQS